LGSHFFLAPIAVGIFPLQAGGLDFDRPPGNWIAVQVGDDEVYFKRRAARDEITLTAQANV